MRRFFVYVCLLCFLLPLNLAFKDASAAQELLETGCSIEDGSSARILAATVHIQISALVGENFIASSGLATAIIQGQQISLVTHNHWKNADQAVGHVTMRNAGGEVLTRIRLPEFQQNIRYQDESVMILGIDDHFKQEMIAPIQIKAPVLPRVGAVVQLVRQHPDANAGLSGSVHLLLNSAQVTSYSEREGLPVIELTIEENDEQFHLGDSGGGVWFDGQLIAQTWLILMFTSPVELGSVSGGEPLHNSRYGVAAQLPWRLNSWSNWQAAITSQDRPEMSAVKEEEVAIAKPIARLQSNGSMTD